MFCNLNTGLRARYWKRTAGNEGRLSSRCYVEVSKNNVVLAYSSRVEVGRGIIFKYLVHKHPFETSNTKAKTDQAGNDGYNADLFRVKAVPHSLSFQTYAAGNSKAYNSTEPSVLTPYLRYIIHHWYFQTRYI